MIRRSRRVISVTSSSAVSSWLEPAPVRHAPTVRLSRNAIDTAPAANEHGTAADHLSALCRPASTNTTEEAVGDQCDTNAVVN